MIVIGKFTQLQLNNDYDIAKSISEDYHGVFESIEHLMSSLKTKPLVIGEFYESTNIEGLDRRLFVMSQLPNIYKELQSKMTNYPSQVCLLNIKETKDKQGRTFYYILDAMVIE